MPDVLESEKVTQTTEIRTEAVPACMLCGLAGEVLYSGIRDRVFGTPGEWNFSRCPGCHLIWLNPRPLKEDIPRTYESFYTHDAFVPPRMGDEDRSKNGLRYYLRRLILGNGMGYPRYRIERWWANILGKLLALLSPLRLRATYGLGLTCPPYLGQGRLLDIGCGNGSYLYHMKELGWEVSGLDIDPVAAKNAEEILQRPIVIGSLEDVNFPSNSFDVIHMYHLIEHVPNPIETLKECHRILSPGGIVIIGTNNVGSLVHWWFKENYVQLDAPHHHCLFTPETLKKTTLASGLTIFKLLTRTTWAACIFNASWQIQHTGRADFVPRNVTLWARWFALMERLLTFAYKGAASEIVLLARKAG